jgi:chitin disaccharide deacetylase
MTAPVLVVNADDFGLSRGVNEGIIEAHLQGIVTSASLMVKQPGAEEASALARQLPTLGVGLHFDVGEWLLEGSDWITVYERVSGSDPAALKRELDEQLAIFQELNQSPPTHIDSHQHAHLREPLRSIVVDVAQQAALPVRHITPKVRYRGEFFGHDGKGGTLHERLEPAWLATFISGLEPGVSELCCHPASFVDFQSDYTQERVKELRALCSPEARAAVRDCGISLQNFRTLHERDP